jgi:hypothetical protein
MLSANEGKKMPQDPKDFVQDWLAENINAEAYQPGESARVRELADQCRQDAAAEGISKEALEEAARDMVGGRRLAGDNYF